MIAQKAFLHLKKSIYLLCDFKLSITLLIGAFVFSSHSIWARQTNPSNSIPSEKLTRQSENFIENMGQVWDYNNQPQEEVKFVFEHQDLQLFLMNNGIAYQFTRVHYPEAYLNILSDKSSLACNVEEISELEHQIRTETFRMNMELEGANPKARISKEGKSSDYINYYNRNVTEVYSYSKITYHDIYEGIDWVIYSKKGEIKYDFVLRAGANPSQIKLKFTHYEQLKLNPDGSLRISNRMGIIKEKAPISFQEGTQIATDFILNDNIFSFKLSEYNPNKPLIIDPILQWTTYFGGTESDGGNAVATDLLDNVYLAGFTHSINNIALNGHQNIYGANNDAFLVKFNSNGLRLWATYYGGENSDGGNAVATDKLGNVYLAGRTNSGAGISFNGHQNIHGAGSDAFLVKFNTSGIRLWATYYGGIGSDIANSVTTDEDNNVYLAGQTSSNTNISFNGHQNVYAGSDIGVPFGDGFLVKFNPNGARQWATYYGGNSGDWGTSCKTDNAGNIYLAGVTRSAANIAFNGHKNAIGADNLDAYLVKFNLNGVRQWATYYESGSTNIWSDCATDLDGNIYLAGVTRATSNIAFNGHQNIYGGGSDDAFLAKFNSNGDRIWATYYGGENLDFGRSVITDRIGNVYLAGFTQSSDSISYLGHQNTYAGLRDAYLVKFTSNGIRLWASYYGGAEQDISNACAIDHKGMLYLSGATFSPSNISLNGHQNSFGGFNDAFLAKFISCNVVDTITIVTCDSFAWEINGETYYESGMHQAYIINERGCDTMLTLDLSILTGFYDTLYIDTCGDFTWEVNNVTYNQSGIYTENLEDQFGCDSFHTLVLTLDSLPSVLQLTASPLLGCEPLEVNFELVTSYPDNFTTVIFTTDTDSLLMVSGNNMLQTILTAGNYTPKLVFTTQSGCKAEAFSDPIEVYPKPFASFNFTPEEPDLDYNFVQFKNLSTGATRYLWNINPFGQNSDFEPEFTYNEIGTYPVSLIAINDQDCSDTTDGQVIIRPNYRVFFPNAFTPNGDGVNDIFQPTMSGFSKSDFKVFNRWGELMFQSQDNTGWNGTYKNQPAPEGIYMYYLKIQNLNGQNQLFRGTVTLIR